MLHISWSVHSGSSEFIHNPRTKSRWPFRLWQASERPRRGRAWRPVLEQLEDRTLLATFIVSNLNDIGGGTLRSAIQAANGNPGPDTITFAVAGTINILNGSFPLPSLSDASGGTTIDGTTAPGYAGAPVVFLRGPGSGVGLSLTSANNEVRGLQIGSFDTGIQINGFGGAASGNTIVGNFIGNNGTTAFPNAFAGIDITNGANNNRIGTDGDGQRDAAERNIISGNGGAGIIVQRNSSGNAVAGNFIGSDVTGTVALANGTSSSAQFKPGIYIFEASNNRIGTDGNGFVDDAERNLISGNRSSGVSIDSGNDNIVAGNFIGTNATGTSALPNAGPGISIGAPVGSDVGGANRNRIGTDGNGVADAAERNVISGNSSVGIVVNRSLAGGSTDGTVIAGNFIGTDVTGSYAIGNYGGVGVADGATNTRIGTNSDGLADVAERNIISGNTNTAGVGTAGSGTIVAGNFIGTDVTGTRAIPNLAGASVWNGLVGTNGDGLNDDVERNIISGNLEAGITVGAGGMVAGNYVGTDVTGTIDLGNATDGVQAFFTSGGRIGTNADGANDAAERNVISGNGRSGVYLRGATNFVVAGNFIGTDATGAGPMGNTLHGILIDYGASDNTVGGIVSAVGNTIAFNGQDGVALINDFFNPGSPTIPPVRNRITHNSIHSNGGLGIDLKDDGRTLNDLTDNDAGPNSLQNFPTVNSVSSSDGSTTIEGTLASTPNSSFTVEFFANSNCDPSAFGEGEQFLGSTNVTTDESGNAAFLVSLPVAISLDKFITVTATD